jgi:hypothetical protein
LNLFIRSLQEDLDDPCEIVNDICGHLLTLSFRQ